MEGSQVSQTRRPHSGHGKTAPYVDPERAKDIATLRRKEARLRAAQRLVVLIVASLAAAVVVALLAVI